MVWGQTSNELANEAAPILAMEEVRYRVPEKKIINFNKM